MHLPLFSGVRRFIRMAVLLLPLGLGACSDISVAKQARTQPRMPAVPKKTVLHSETETVSIGLVELPSEDARQRAPGFDGASGWINIDHPISMDELKGRAVIVDFWTSCCINCLHTLPVLKRVEERFKSEPVVVIGVHSPKFDEEKELPRLRDIVRDQRIEHPVALDASMHIWNTWGVDAWPTVAILDTSGRLVWAAMGEPSESDLMRVTASVLEEGKRKSMLASAPLKGLSPERPSDDALRYPGKVLALPQGGLAIADTGHHRIVLLDKDGRTVDVIGSGLEGKQDGEYDAASFSRPQGMALAGDDLYVADTGNHMIRKINQKLRLVTTVAGTGELAAKHLSEKPMLARGTALRSPWDLLYRKGFLYVALAGSHQIALYDPIQGSIRIYAGTGEETRTDGPAAAAAFAQPSALATDDRELFVLDSETSSVRAIDFVTTEVRTLVGHDLFVFGDKDGDRESTRLQHPIGMAYGEGALWIADTYNSKIKRIDPKTSETRTLSGVSGLSEPAGLAVLGQSLFVADTNRHRIVYVNLADKNKGALSALAMPGLRAPLTGISLEPKAQAAQAKTLDAVSLGLLKIPRASASEGAKAILNIGFRIPAGTAINADAPFKLIWEEAHGLIKVPEPQKRLGKDVQQGVRVELEPAKNSISGALAGTLELMLCDDVTHRVCVPYKRSISATFSVVDGAPSSSSPAELRVTVELPAAQ